MSSPALFSRDFESLRGGETFESRGRTVTETDVVSFAALTGDWHPQHTDAVWAEGSRFGARVAHGMLVLSYSIGLVRLDPSRVVALRGVRDAVFKRPVRIGDTIHVEGSIDELKELDPTLGAVRCSWRIVNQRGRLVARATIEVLWRRGEEDGAVPSAMAGDVREGLLL